MDGQYTIWGIASAIKTKPCEYSFNRYIGQEIKTSRGIKTISGIGKFYTYFTDNTVGTPYDMHPLNEKEERYEQMD